MASRIATTATAAALLLAALLAPAIAHAEPTAQEKDAARALMDRADGLFDAKDYLAALKAYQSADVIMHVPTTGIEVAKTQAALGRLVAARASAAAVADSPEAEGEPAPFAEARAEARRMLTNLDARIPVLDVRVDGVDGSTLPSIVIDGEAIPSDRAAVPMTVDPGPHVVVAVLHGYADARRDVTVEEGEKLSVALHMVVGESSAKRAPLVHGLSPLALGGLGAGGVSLALGATFGLVSVAQTSSIKSRCVADRCPPSVAGAITTAKGFGAASDVFLGLGLVGVGVGVVGVVWKPGERKETPSVSGAGSAALVLGPGSVGVQGVF